MDFVENLIVLGVDLKDFDAHAHARIDNHRHWLSFEWKLIEL